MKSLLTFCALLALTSVTASADPVDEVLQKIDDYLAVTSFADAYVTGDSTKSHMDEDFNGIKSNLAATEDVAAFPDRAEITVRGSDGRVIRVDTLRASDWAAYRGNYARAIINQLMGAGVQVDMRITGYQDVHLMVNGRPARFGAVELTYTGSSIVGKVEGMMLVTNGLPARAQVLVRRENQLGILRVWTVDSFNRPSPAN